jgi:hypothetical protein
MDMGIVRLIRSVWSIPGYVKLRNNGLERVKLRQEHPLARNVCKAFRPLHVSSHIDAILS